MPGWGVVALMIPYALVMLVAWIVLYAAWFLPGIPLGPDSPIKLWTALHHSGAGRRPVAMVAA